jgi:NAD(P)H-dependent FMN reductase
MFGSLRLQNYAKYSQFNANWGILVGLNMLTQVDMASILAFAGSNSSTSINFSLVKYTASLLEEHEVRVMNMANMPFPMYSQDIEKEKGFSNSIVELKEDIQAADGLIISVNEHNGNPSAYTKNLLDWLSRLDRNFLSGLKILLMATSPGARGGQGSLKVVEALIPRFGGEVVTTFLLPSFRENFDPDTGITNPELARLHQAALTQFLSQF